MAPSQLPMTLADRLRDAALQRAEAAGEQFDGYVLEPTGVLDLRRVINATPGSGSHPAKLPSLGSAPIIENLYRRRWLDRSSLRRRNRSPVIDLRNQPVE